MKRTTLLLADDHSPVLDYLTQMLSNEFEIVGVFGDGQAAFEAAFALKPEAVVFDISMPVLSGLAAAARLTESPQPPRVVFLTVHEDQDFVDAAFNVGALGYVLKRRLGTDLIPAIRAALAGRAFVSPSLMPAVPVRAPAL
ncbi:MAG TPA: response regulator transcription factor [Vicinamibacterales bacterium]|jgi:DNA-binding NarL/FixJ family response regulator|nr:response regulator transcription factor [Vicinamibacterales bacterium]